MAVGCLHFKREVENGRLNVHVFTFCVCTCMCVCVCVCVYICVCMCMSVYLCVGHIYSLRVYILVVGSKYEASERTKYFVTLHVCVYTVHVSVYMCVYMYVYYVCMCVCVH